MHRRLRLALLGGTLAVLLTATPTLACGGLIGPNGAVNLLNTTTFVGYHDGVEHYVTAFKFEGGGGAFGSLTPLPGIPTSVEKGGDWTLQRLVRETAPELPGAFLDQAAAGSRASAEVLMTVKIDALDITILKGGADEVGTWAKDHGFRLPPDSPEVLDFYARRSPIFLAAAFDADAAKARGQAIGDGTSVHVTIPTTNPWVPIRILALGKHATDAVQADVYLLTDRKPAMLPATDGSDGLEVTHSDGATDSLLNDLRSDRGMGWVPQHAWLTKVAVNAPAQQLSFDLAIDATGHRAPSAVAAGLEWPPATTATSSAGLVLFVGLLALSTAFALVAVAATGGRRPTAAA